MNHRKNSKEVIYAMKRLAMFFILNVIILLIPQSGYSTGIFGNGVDGPLVVSGTHDMTADREYTDLTINAGSTLETHGFTIRVSGTLLNNGIITDSFSGGNGGAVGTGGSGGKFASGHNPPNNGLPGSCGFGATVSGGGIGGNGGGGGGGGGAAWDTGANKYGAGGNGGNGGLGGKGGGVVIIYAQNFNNNNLIHANGQNGFGGNFGTIGTYDSWTEFISNYDVAGGGGGGGAGGSGGGGGTVDVFIGTLINNGTLSASGGIGGSGRAGGAGINAVENSSSNSLEENGVTSVIVACTDGFGGTGGRGEMGSVSSNNGAPGQSGFTGSNGTTSISNTVICYVDADNDGFGNAGDAGTPSVSCGAGFSENNFDCDDNDPNINPDAVEITGDGIDQNCDGGDVCFADNDADGFGSGSLVNSADLDCSDPGESLNSNDCDDSDPAVNPGTTEICNNLDDNCNSLIDEGFDADGDGFTTCGGDCDDSDPAVNPGTTEICNNLDDNCNSLIDEGFDADGDGFTTCGGDCDDSDPAVNPGATEIVGDGIDQDCDGTEICYQDNDADGFGTNATILSFDLTCTDINESYTNDDCNDADASIFPGAVEIPGNGIDEDCDGVDASCCIVDRGNANGGSDDGTLAGSVSVADLVFLVAFMFQGGAEPACLEEADVNGSGGVAPISVTDLVVLVAFMFQGGTPPAPCL